MGELNQARLWLPSSARASAEDPKFHCRICGSVSSTNGEYERHAARHARYDLDEIRAESPAVKHPGIYGDDGVDLEWQNFWKNRLEGGR